MVSDYTGVPTRQLRENVLVARRFIREIVPGPIRDMLKDQIREMEYELRVRRFIRWHKNVAETLGDEPHTDAEIRSALQSLR